MLIEFSDYTHVGAAEFLRPGSRKEGFCGQQWSRGHYRFVGRHFHFTSWQAAETDTATLRTDHDIRATRERSRLHTATFITAHFAGTIRRRKYHRGRFYRGCC